MKYKILLLNTPSIIIDGQEAKVGDWLDDNSIITWELPKQAMKVISEDNHRYTVSPTAYKEARAKKFKDYISYAKPMAHRGSNSLVEKLLLRLEGYHVLFDEITFDLSDLNLPENTTFTATSDEMIFDESIINLSFKNNELIVSRKDIEHLLNDNNIMLNLQMNGQPITQYFEIEVVSRRIKE